MNLSQILKKSVRILGSVFLLTSLGCKVTDALNSTAGMDQRMIQLQSGMDTTNKNMEKMVDAVHDQQVVLPYEQLLTAENATVLKPIPFKMMAYGEKMAQAMTAEELVKLTYIWLKEIDESQPEKDSKDCKVNEVGKEICGKPFYSKELLARTNHEKEARFAALKVLAGFAPQSIIEEIVQEHLTTPGRFRRTTLNLLTLRSMMLKEILLDESILKEELWTIKVADEGFKYMNQLNYIAEIGKQLPARKLQLSFSLNGFLSQPGQAKHPSNKVYSFDPLNEMRDRWTTFGNFIQSMLINNQDFQSFATAEEKQAAQQALQKALQMATTWPESNPSLTGMTN